MYRALFNHPTWTPAIQLSIRAAISAAVTVEIAQLLGLQFPVNAMIGAIIVSDLAPTRTRELGIWRLGGSVLGATVGALFSAFVPSGVLMLGLSVFIAIFFSYLLRLHDAARLAGYVCGIVVLGHSQEPWTYALLRLVETILGVTVAILVSLVPKLIGVDEPKASGE